MGLLDEVRDSKDSWNVRYEEHRAEKEDYDHKFEEQNRAKIEEQIKKNCDKVGKFAPLSDR